MALSLSVDFIHKTIDEVCRKPFLLQNGTGSSDGKSVVLHRATTPCDWNCIVSSLSSSDSATRNASDEEPDNSVFSADFRTPFYFGIQATNSDPPQDCGRYRKKVPLHQPGDELVGFCTFYIAYSTWDGRVLYVDKINPETDGSLLLYRAMAIIATYLGCDRFTWKQKERPEWKNAIVNPEYLEDWMFLSMDRLAMANFVGSPSLASSSCCPHEGKIAKMKPLLFLFVEDTIRETLFEQTTITTNSNESVTLRLAGPEDTEIIDRLVHQLAAYEKEPDAVKMDSENYFLDGYDSTEPLFYCILADVIATNDEVDGKAAPATTVAMGLFYIGHDLLDGPFLYLEDLFCDEAFRGKGVGTAIMKQLARISLELDCRKFVWTALDWNAPALSFYEKIGATIENESKITRYCGSDLQSFALNKKASSVGGYDGYDND